MSTSSKLSCNAVTDICPTREPYATNDDNTQTKWRTKQQGSTNYQVAQMAGVSEDTLRKTEKILQRGDDNMIQQARREDMVIAGIPQIV